MSGENQTTIRPNTPPVVSWQIAWIERKMQQAIYRWAANDFMETDRLIDNLRRIRLEACGRRHVGKSP